MKEFNNSEAIKESVKQLKNGNVILFPSDSVWGLSCDATNAEAVEKIINLKGKNREKSFIVLVNSDRMINQCVKDFPAVAWDLIDLAEKPLTLVLDGGQYVAPNVINKDGSLGLRKVKEGDIFDLIRSFNKPIISSSANFSGEATPLSYQDIDPKLKEKVDFIYPIVKVQNKATSPSKIIRVGLNGDVKILRK